MAARPAGNNYLALDVGDVRIGVAIAGAVARIAHPAGALLNDGDVWVSLSKIVTDEAVGTLVIGLPRNLQGDDTPQTTKIREFARAAEARLGLPVVLQDEALTSRAAEAELIARGGHYTRGDIDALAATRILDDYLMERSHE